MLELNDFFACKANFFYIFTSRTISIPIYIRPSVSFISVSSSLKLFNCVFTLSPYFNSVKRVDMCSVAYTVLVL